MADASRSGSSTERGASPSNSDTNVNSNSSRDGSTQSDDEHPDLDVCRLELVCRDGRVVSVDAAKGGAFASNRAAPVVEDDRPRRGVRSPPTSPFARQQRNVRVPQGRRPRYDRRRMRFRSRPNRPRRRGPGTRARPPTAPRRPHPRRMQRRVSRPSAGTRAGRPQPAPTTPRSTLCDRERHTLSCRCRRARGTRMLRSTRSLTRSAPRRSPCRFPLWPGRGLATAHVLQERLVS